MRTCRGMVRPGQLHRGSSGHIKDQSRGSTPSMALVNRAGGPQRSHIAQRLLEHLLIKIQNGVKGLILGAGRDIVNLGQLGEKRSSFLLLGNSGGMWRRALI
jgi:hypothetical protein